MTATKLHEAVFREKLAVDGQEIPCLSWNPVVQYCIHKKLALVPTLKLNKQTKNYKKHTKNYAKFCWYKFQYWGISS